MAFICKMGGMGAFCPIRQAIRSGSRPCGVLHAQSLMESLIVVTVDELSELALLLHEVRGEPDPEALIAERPATGATLRATI